MRKGHRKQLFFSIGGIVGYFVYVRVNGTCSWAIGLLPELNSHFDINSLILEKGTLEAMFFLFL